MTSKVPDDLCSRLSHLLASVFFKISKSLTNHKCGIYWFISCCRIKQSSLLSLFKASKKKRFCKTEFVICASLSRGTLQKKCSCSCSCSYLMLLFLSTVWCSKKMRKYDSLYQLKQTDFIMSYHCRYSASLVSFCLGLSCEASPFSETMKNLPTVNNKAAGCRPGQSEGMLETYSAFESD